MCVLKFGLFILIVFLNQAASDESGNFVNTTLSAAPSADDASSSAEPTLVASSAGITSPPLPDSQRNTTRPSLLALPPRMRAIVAAVHSSENEYGYVEVRPGAFLFWWLYFADGAKESAHTKPLVIWIQGGPSIPGSGLGNFVEIGPLTMSLKKRNHTWVNGRNVLFVDSPVGTGYSYTTSDDLYCKTDKDVAADLIHLLKALLEKFPQFKTTPIHIFSQSYGTKIAAYFAYYLHKDVDRGNVQANLKTVAFGSSWINPKVTSLATGEYLYQIGILDQPDYLRARSLLANLTAMIDRKEYKEAFKYRNQISGEVFNDDVLRYDVYNVFQPSIFGKVMQLTALMNGLVSIALGSPYSKRAWAFHNSDVYAALEQDFMKPAQHVVERILNETSVRVVVYNGDFDAITPIAGAVSWVHDLRWAGADGFRAARRRSLLGQANGFVKEHGRLGLWWVLRAGHWVPTDNPAAMEQILQSVINGTGIDARS